MRSQRPNLHVLAGRALAAVLVAAVGAALAMALHVLLILMVEVPIVDPRS